MVMAATTQDAKTPSSQEARIAALYSEHGRRLLAYALRRASGPEDAADVVAETFLTACRRAEDVPAGEEARLWLYGVARNVLLNQRRGERRRARLGDRLRAELATATFPAPASETEMAVKRVLGEMEPVDREVLTLAGWEGLDPAQIARVLDLPAVTVRGRLHRARRRLRRALIEAQVPYDTPQIGDWQLGEAR